MAAANRTTGAEEWWQTLPEKDVFQHSQNSPAVASRRHARTGGQRKMSWKPYGDARVSVASDADANNLENQRCVLADWEQVFEDVGSGTSWNRPGLNRLKDASLQATV